MSSTVIEFEPVDTVVSEAFVRAFTALRFAIDEGADVSFGIHAGEFLGARLRVLAESIDVADRVCFLDAAEPCSAGFRVRPPRALGYPFVSSDSQILASMDDWRAYLHACARQLDEEGSR